MNAIPPAFHADWVRLWRLVRHVEASTAENFLDVGLGLVDPTVTPRTGDYASSPVNATMFAGTGGDGVHFSVLHVASGNSATAPVVMTVPMAFGSPNHVVGGSLAEFLALGCHVGYFGLERLAYSWGRQGLIAQLQTVRLEPGTDGARLLRALIDEFDLRPWPDVELRLNELDATYRGNVLAA
jgi:hypothetical protein